MSCPCGKEIILGPGSHNRWFDAYCSHYCSIYYQDPTKYPDVRVSDSKHHSGIFRRPNISANCDLCEKPFNLRNEEKEGNRHFCSIRCSRKLIKTKHGHRDWTLLKLIQLYGPITADNIAQRYCTNLTRMTTSTASSILRLYRARGIVIGEEASLDKIWKRRMQYSINTNLPLAKIVVERIKVK
jgi:hypothetical protein